MSAAISVATPTDAPKLAEVFFAAFSDDFNRTMFPLTPEVRTWAATQLLGGHGAQKHETFLKIEDPSDPGVVMGFAKWVRVAGRAPSAAADHDGSTGTAWPEGSDKKLCERFFGEMERRHRVAIGNRPHYCMSLPFFFFFLRFFVDSFFVRDIHFRLFCLVQLTSIPDLEILGIHPSYQGRGLASKLLKWGLERADEESLEAYLSSSPEGRPVYEKYGFLALDSFSPFPGYEQLDMIRPVNSKGESLP